MPRLRLALGAETIYLPPLLVHVGQGVQDSLEPLYEIGATSLSITKEVKNELPQMWIVFGSRPGEMPAMLVGGNG